MILTRTLALVTLATLTVPAFAEDAKPRMTVMKTESCGCCNAWIDHLEANGFEVEARNMPYDALDRLKTASGIAEEHKSCHTGMVGGYVVEGHVPASDIHAMLERKPDALGLSVPAMPVGSPGMEMGARRDAYDVLLLEEGDGSEVFSAYDAR